MQLDSRTVFTQIKRLFIGFDKPLALFMFLLLGVGLVTLYSASLDAPGRVEDQVRNILLTFALMWAIANIPTQTLMRLAVPLYTVGIGLLIGVAMFGLTRKGARRWINVGVVIQPSEVMKIAMPLMLAWYYQKREGVIRWYDYIVGLLLLAVPVGLIAKQPDLGTAVLVLASGLFVIYFAGLSFRLILPILLAVVIAAGTVVAFENKICQPEVQWPMMHDYQKHRICILLDPQSDPLGQGFHTIQAVIAIGSGGTPRQGLAQGHAGPPRVHSREAHRFHLRGVFRGIRAGGGARAALSLPMPDRAGTLCRCERGDLVRAAAGRRARDVVLHLCDSSTSGWSAGSCRWSACRCRS